MYERDNETELDFAQARYYNKQHGRFTSVDPLLASGNSANPQSFNRYVYVQNSPLIANDPTGLIGDYYTRSGTYIGRDDDPKTEGKVYFGDIGSKEGDVTYVTNAVETNNVELLRVQNFYTRSRPGMGNDAIQTLSSNVVEGVSDGLSGIAQGVGNGVIGIVNTATNPLGPVGAAAGVPNPFAIHPFTSANARQASYASASETGFNLGLIFAGGTLGSGSSLSVVPEESAFVGPKQLEYAVKVRERALTDPRAHNFPYSFDSQILSNTPISKPNGYRMFRQPGTMNQTDGVFELGVRKDFVIDHRVFRSR